MNDSAGGAFLRCINPDCASTYGVKRTVFTCDDCGDLLDVAYDWDAIHASMGFDRNPATFTARHASAVGYSGGDTEARLNLSGVWRFREMMPYFGDLENIQTIGEGRTYLQHVPCLASSIGLESGQLFLQYEGLNPSGSFKDNGMTGAFTHAKVVDAKRCVCASTGNTSASLALFAALTGLRSYVLIGSGKIAYGKLSQALDYGARTIQVEGDFDACLKRVRELAEDRPELGIYLMNSVNPFRLEGQKAIMFRILEGLGWEVPDWIVVPGGNLGNSSAFGKAFMELRELGMIDKLPRLAIINAHGARTLDRIYNELNIRWNGGRCFRDSVRGEYERMDAANERASTVASAIEINRPVNLPKALRALEVMDGVVRNVPDDVILEHKALVGRFGFGCEPASAASVAGARMLLKEGIIKPTETVACVLTGHQLKDPDATVRYHTGIDMKAVQETAPRHGIDGDSSNQPVQVPDDIEAIIKALD